MTGRTALSRAVLHECSDTGRQIPAVTRSGPQSHPKLHAIFRIALKGWWFECGRAPSSRLALSA
jgi:hypothetical protein